jgi:predicted nucleic acid-binding protein
VPDYLLDTNILRFWYDTRCDEHEQVLARVQAIRQPEPLTEYIPRLFISVVTLGEIEYGHSVAAVPDPKKQSEYSRFVREQCPQSLEVTRHVAEPYGELKAWLFEKPSNRRKRTKAMRDREVTHPTPAKELHADENDLWIAAQAMTFNLVLVTHDSRGNFGKLLGHFSSTLQVEDWAR